MFCLSSVTTSVPTRQHNRSLSQYPVTSAQIVCRALPVIPVARAQEVARALGSQRGFSTSRKDTQSIKLTKHSGNQSSPRTQWPNQSSPRTQWPNQSSRYSEPFTMTNTIKFDLFIEQIVIKFFDIKSLRDRIRVAQRDVLVSQIFIRKPCCSMGGWRQCCIMGVSQQLCILGV